MRQLHHKKLINTLPPTPVLASSSTYLIDTLCSAIDYSTKEDEYTRLLFEKDRKVDENKDEASNKKLELNEKNQLSNIKSLNTTENNQYDTTNAKTNENELNITEDEDENIPDVITKDSLIYQQYLYWRYICRNVMSDQD